MNNTKMTNRESILAGFRTKIDDVIITGTIGVSDDGLKYIKDTLAIFLSQSLDQIADEVRRETSESRGVPITAERFWLMRTEDVSGVSGVGVVADGVIFPDGVTVLKWRTTGGSTAVYDSIQSVEEIHGHDGKTTIEYV